MSKETMTAKKQMTVELENAVNKVVAIKEQLRDKAVEVEDSVAEASGAVKELEAELLQVQESKAFATDIETAKAIIKKEQELTSTMELQKGVNTAISNKTKADLESTIVELYAEHKKASFLYRAVEMEYKATVSLRDLEQDEATLNKLASELNGAFSYARQVLLDFAIIAPAEQNRMYKGTHLGARELWTNLKVLFTPDARRAN